MITNNKEFARTKLALVRQDIEVLNDELRAFMDSGAHQVVREEQPEGENSIISFRFRAIQPIPDSIFYKLGIVIYGLRSACDNILFPVAKRLGVDNAEKIGFPICESEGGKNGLGNWLKRFEGFPPDVESVIQGAQPFNPYPTPHGDLVGDIHPMFVLNELSKPDKHRDGLKIVGHHNGAAVQIHPLAHFGHGGPFQSSPSYMSRSRVLEDGAVIVSFTLPPNQPPATLNVNVSVEVVLDEMGPITGAPIHPTLVKLHDFIRDEVVTKLEPFL